jgi:hypothetical protein
MATYTTNYNLTKPTFSELADVRAINGNMDTIDDVMNASQNSIAEPYDSTKTYNEGDMVMYELYLYRCLEETTGTWDATKWERAYSASSGAGIVYPQDATKYLNGVGQWAVPAGGGDYYSPVIYSTEEREVGVWVDNKPIYQKTFVSNITLQSNGWTQTNLNIQNLDSIIKSEVVRNNVTDTSDDGYIIAGVDIDHTNGRIDLFNFKTVEINVTSITIWYTKTTDTAGSGSYNTLGVPKVHYSTSEQVIGTWIDGSTLYEKTIDMGSTQTYSNEGWYSIEPHQNEYALVFNGKLIDESGLGYNVDMACNDATNLEMYVRHNTIGRYLTFQYTKAV